MFNWFGRIEKKSDGYINRDTRGLDFNNTDSFKYTELATAKLNNARVALKQSRENQNEKEKRQLNQGGYQSLLEGTELLQKSVVEAINLDGKIHERAIKTHDNPLLQIQQERINKHIFEKGEIDSINMPIKLLKDDPSQYNAIRYSKQDISDKNLEKGINILEKGVKRLETMEKNSKYKHNILIGGLVVHIGKKK